MDNLNAWNENTRNNHRENFWAFSMNGNFRFVFHPPMSIIRFWLLFRFTLSPLKSTTRPEKLIAEKNSSELFDFSGYLLEWIGRKEREPEEWNWNWCIKNSMLGGFLRLTRFWLFINDNQKNILILLPSPFDHLVKKSFLRNLNVI